MQELRNEEIHRGKFEDSRQMVVYDVSFGTHIDGREGTRFVYPAAICRRSQHLYSIDHTRIGTAALEIETFSVMVLLGTIDRDRNSYVVVRHDADPLIIDQHT